MNILNKSKEDEKMSILATAITAAKRNRQYVSEIKEAMISNDRVQSLLNLAQKNDEEQAMEMRAQIQVVINNITRSVEEALKNVEVKEAEAIKRVSSQLIEYLIACLENGVEPVMVTTAFDNISEETIRKMFMDPQFDIVDYMNNPDKYIKEVREDEEVSAFVEAAQSITDETLEKAEEQAEEIVETLKAALNPVTPIVKELPNGQVELDMSKINIPATAAQEPLRPTEAPAPKENKKEKKKDKKSNHSEEHHECTDANCACHGDGINWPGNIQAYFDTASLFMVKNKETKKAIGERIARAFDNFDTLQELSQYLGDAPENPFGFKLTSVKNQNNFELTTERTIGGKYTKLTFSFFDGGATITAA